MPRRRHTAKAARQKRKIRQKKKKYEKKQQQTEKEEARKLRSESSAKALLAADPRKTETSFLLRHKNIARDLARRYRKNLYALKAHPRKKTAPRKARPCVRRKVKK